MKQAQHLRRYLTSLLLLAVTTLTWAYSFAVDGIYYDKNTDGTSVTVTYKTTSYNSYSGSVVIPSTVTYIGETYSVTSIGYSAFRGCTGLTSVTIGSGVTTIGRYAFSSCYSLTSINIPESVTSIGKDAFYGTSWYHSQPDGLVYAGKVAYKYKGTMPSGTEIVIKDGTLGIAESAFYGCSGLTSITIPNSVTSIGSEAFYKCSGLTSITIPNSVTSIGSEAFYNCSGLTSITIPNSVTSIGSEAFYNCYRLTSITIPNSVTSIGSEAFYNCYRLTSITIPNSVTSIGSSAFYGCTSLTKAEFASIESLCKIKFSYSDSNPLYYAKHLYIDGQEVTDVVIPNSVTSIGWYAFNGCSNLTNVTLPDKLSYIGSHAFPSNTKIYVNKGVPAIFAAWRYGIAPYEVSTNTSLASPTLSVSSTQATVTASVSPVHSGLTYKIDGKYKITSKSSSVKYTGLRPGESRTVELVVSAGGDSYTVSKSVTTKALNPSISLASSSASSVKVQGATGDAEIISESFTVNGVTKTGHTANFTGLTPNQKYSVEYKALVKYGTSGEKTYTYTAEGEVSTSTLTLTTSQPKVISAGNVIVEAVSNLDDEEENVGFEWRRTDYTDDFPSNKGTAYLYEGVMEGYIRNLNTEKLWKVRPYYQSGNGTYYYGQWIGLDPTNTSYFEPTVHTYAKINVTGNKALVSGYVQRGSDAVRKQGFKYWVSESGARVAADAGLDSRALAASAVPSGATTVEAEGRIMEAELSNLSYSTTYSYVAFVTTTEGETFYGKQLTFTTEDAPTGIDSLQADEAADSATQASSQDDTAIYDLNGRRMQHKPAHGFYIQGGKKYFVK